MSCFCAFQLGDTSKSPRIQFPLCQLKKSARSTSVHLNSAKCSIMVCVYICIRVIFSKMRTNNINDTNTPSHLPLTLENKWNQINMKMFKVRNGESSPRKHLYTQTVSRTTSRFPSWCRRDNRRMKSSGGGRYAFVHSFIHTKTHIVWKHC